MAYVRVPIPVPKTGKGKIIFGIVMTGLFLFVGLMLVIGGISGPAVTSVKGIETVAYTELNTETAYEFKDVYVISKYATWTRTSDGKTTELDYYLLQFTDADGAYCFASLEVSPLSRLGKTCSDYMEDDTMLIGDLKLDEGVFTCEDLWDQPDEVVSYYNESYDEYSGTLRGQSIGKHFVYKAVDADTFMKDQTASNTGLLIVGIVFVVGCSVGLFFLIRGLKKIKKAQAEYEAQVAAYQAAMYNGGYPNAYPDPNGYPNGGNYPPMQGQ